MEITFVGANTFRLKTKTVVVVGNATTNKERGDVSYSVVGEAVELPAATRDKSFRIEKDGEYELGMVSFIFDSQKDNKAVEFKACTLRAEGVILVDLSAYLGQDLTDKQIEKYGEADVVFANVSNANYAIDKLAPTYLILTGYESMDGLEGQLSSVKFENLKKDLDKLKIDADSLSENTEVIALHV